MLSPSDGPTTGYANGAAATARVYPPGPRSRCFGYDFYRDSQRDPLAFMSRLARDHGDIVHFKIGRRHVYLLNRPEHIKGVLSSHYASFLKGRGIVRRDNFLGLGLLTSEGDFHRRQRLLTRPAFDHDRFNGYGETMARLAREASDGWREGDRFDVLDTMRKITLPIASQTLFGTDVATDHQEIIAAIRVGLSRFSAFRPALSRVSDRLSWLRRYRLRRARLALEAIVSRIIVARRGSDGDQADLLSLLLSRGADADEGLTSDRQIRDEAITLFIGGFENVATTLTWTWYLLARHPEVDKKLRAELDSVLGGKLPTAADVRRLTYTRMVLEESMRIYPPVPRLVRTTLTDYQVGEYSIPAGALVVVSQYLVHRDARYYPDPDRFDPERWTSEAKATRPSHAYFPFGGGPRRCIGEGFALMEGVLVLATLASRWRLALASTEPVRLRATHFLHPREIMTMIVERRA